MTLEPYRTQLEFIEGLHDVVLARQAAERPVISYRPCFVPRPARRGCGPNEHRLALDRHAERVALTRASGILLPLDRLAAEHGLNELDLRLAELLLVETTDLNRRKTAVLAAGHLARCLGRWEGIPVQALLPRLLPGSALERSGLVRIRRRNSAPALWKLRIPLKVLLDLLASR